MCSSCQMLGTSLLIVVIWYSIRFDGDLVIATPDIYQVKLGPDAEFVLLATDGLWDYIKRFSFTCVNVLLFILSISWHDEMAETTFSLCHWLGNKHARILLLSARMQSTLSETNLGNMEMFRWLDSSIYFPRKCLQLVYLSILACLVQVACDALAQMALVMIFAFS